MITKCRAPQHYVSVLGCRSVDLLALDANATGVQHGQGNCLTRDFGWDDSFVVPVLGLACAASTRTFTQRLRDPKEAEEKGYGYASA